MRLPRKYEENAVRNTRPLLWRDYHKWFYALRSLIGLRFDRNHHNAVRQNRRRKASGNRALIFVIPEVVNAGAKVLRIADLGPFHADRTLAFAAIEENDCPRSILQRT